MQKNKLAVEEKTGTWEEFFKELSSFCANYSSNFTEIGINRNADQLFFFWGIHNFELLEILMARLLSIGVSLFHLVLSKLYLSSTEI